MNPSRVTPSDVFSWIRRHFRNRILFHFITTDKVALTSLHRVTLGESPSLPELPRLQHEENNEAFVQNEGPRGLGAGLPGPGGPVLTISDSAGVPWAFRLGPYVPGKTLVQSAIQEGSIWVTAGSAGLAPGWPPLAAASASSMVMHGISARMAQKRTRGPEGSPDLPEVTQLAGGGAGIRTWYIPLPLSVKFGITPPLLSFILPSATLCIKVKAPVGIYNFTISTSKILDLVPVCIQYRYVHVGVCTCKFNAHCIMQSILYIIHMYNIAIQCS